MPLPAILGAVFGFGKSVLQHRGEIKQAKHERKLKVLTGEISVQQSRIADMAKSWKDEYLVILLSFPFILVFWFALIDDPEGIARVKNAFAVMDDLPDWYQWAFLGVISAVFGLKGVDRFLPGGSK